MNRNATTSPALSVILITPHAYSTIQRTVGALARQTIRERLEIVIVVGSATTLGLAVEDMAPFAAHQVIEIGELRSSAEARAAGARAATSALVALAEDHCYPDPEWADALVRAHEGAWAAVGPAILNANPRTITSRANLVIEYGPWLAPHDGGEQDHIPGHNSCYKRAVLMPFGDALGQWLEAESVLQWQLRSTGHRFAIDSNAKARHENFARLWPSVALRFHGGRLFAARRAQQWGVGRRVGYAMASPLIPVVRWLRCAKDARRASGGIPWRMLPMLAVLLACDGAGEGVGYLTGAGDAMDRLSEMEFRRYRFFDADAPAGS